MNQLTTILKPEFIERCHSIDLDPNVIAIHLLRVKKAVEDKSDLSIPVKDTCRIDNGGLLRVDPAAISDEIPEGLVSFIPAAGASSRYYKPFSKLLWALENDSISEVNEQLTYLRSLGADRWPMPAAVKTLFTGNAPDFRAAAAALKLPKGLLPCVIEGDSFFDVKLAEDQSLPFLDGTMYVVPPEHRSRFEAALPTRFSNRTAFTEQGPELSTIRIGEDCQPFLEDSGNFSLVPAGHGMLAQLIPQVKERFPKAHSVLIRNIDNVVGTSDKVVQAASDAARTHCLIMRYINEIRIHIANDDFVKAKASAKILADRLSIKISDDPLWELQQKLFHTNESILKALSVSPETKVLQTLYNRPVNTLGMVANTRHDVGGTPVFATLNGVDIKLCLEVPHASESDQENFLANPEKATHFNPVFAFAEANFESNYYQDSSLPVWLLAKKTYKDCTVYYHETVLYELLGNNLLANVTFVEIPRLLFNPHKHPKDASGKRLNDWVSST